MTAEWTADSDAADCSSGQRCAHPTHRAGRHRSELAQPPHQLSQLSAHSPSVHSITRLRFNTRTATRRRLSSAVAAAGHLSRPPSAMSASASVGFLHLGASCVVCSEALLTGPHPIRLGAGCIVHPRARIDSSLGPISIGANNVLEEWATVRAADAQGLTLGDNNVLRVGACVEASIGSGNVVDCRAHVTQGQLLESTSAQGERSDAEIRAGRRNWAVAEASGCPSRVSHVCALARLISSLVCCFRQQAALWATAVWSALRCASSGRSGLASCCHQAVRPAALCRAVVPRSCRPISRR